jgi:DNA polymerase-1
MPTMLLVDAFAVIHRAFHALPDFRAPDGTPVNVVYGFFSTFLKAVRDIKPDYVAIAFDLPSPTVRHQVFEAYKAQRPEAPPELSQQVPLVKELIESMGLPILSSPGYEAEDVLATVIQTTQQEDLVYVIVTGDRDTLQLVGDKVKIYFLKRGLSDISLADPRWVSGEYGVDPSQIVDVKALTGDPSDNIPGIAGIGEKTAIDLVKHYGSTEKIMTNLSKLPERPQKLLTGKADLVRQNKDLVTIRTDAPLTILLPQLGWSEDRLARAVPILERYHMKSLINRVVGSAPNKNPRPSNQTTLL